MRKLISWDEAPKCDKQITEPCSDCPWRRDSVPGWLGTHTPEQWLREAHGEALVDCHALKGPQCAGIAIYRANVAKVPKFPQILKLPADRENIFSRPDEFLKHHSSVGLLPKEGLDKK